MKTIKVTQSHESQYTTTKTESVLSPLSPISPISPTSDSNTKLTYANSHVSNGYKIANEYQILSILKRIGFNHGIKLSDTLQGSVWRAEQPVANNVESAVIKITNQYLHAHSAAIVKDKFYSVKENILTEQSILKYLTQDVNCPKSIVQYYKFFKTKTDYWLVMENGGDSLFDFVVKVHKLIRTGHVDASHWQNMTKVIIKQMIECIEFIHSKNVCHFDVSLENFLINDVRISVEQSADGKVNKIQFQLDDIQIKLCDFGLAQKFVRKLCLSSKFCGKNQYKSPEVCYQMRKFNAKKNDVWCLGVCIFLLVTGGCPWNKAHESDDLYVYVKQYGIAALLKQWKLNVNQNIIVLLQSIFQLEPKRISLNDIKKYFYQFIFSSSVTDND